MIHHDPPYASAVIVFPPNLDTSRSAARDPPLYTSRDPPPLHEQISYANVLAERSGETLPDSAIESAAAATPYIQVKKKKSLSLFCPSL